MKKPKKGLEFTDDEIGRIDTGGMQSFLLQLSGSASRGTPLDRAQEIIYEAWEELRPAKRNDPCPCGSGKK